MSRHSQATIETTLVGIKGSIESIRNSWDTPVTTFNKKLRLSDEEKLELQHWCDAAAGFVQGDVEEGLGLLLGRDGKGEEHFIFPLEAYSSISRWFHELSELVGPLKQYDKPNKLPSFNFNSSQHLEEKFYASIVPVVDLWGILVAILRNRTYSKLARKRKPESLSAAEFDRMFSDIRHIDIVNKLVKIDQSLQLEWIHMDGDKQLCLQKEVRIIEVSLQESSPGEFNEILELNRQHAMHSAERVSKPNPFLPLLGKLLASEKPAPEPRPEIPPHLAQFMSQGRPEGMQLSLSHRQREIYGFSHSI